MASRVSSAGWVYLRNVQGVQGDFATKLRAEFRPILDIGKCGRAVHAEMDATLC